jgi:sugar O-acyltransferase (sialic acid O-acetyltransferase NeuD family)
MLQIIGKGGFAREVAAYAAFSSTFYAMGEYDEIDRLFNRMDGTVIAIGDPYVRRKLAEKYSYLSFGRVNYGHAYARVTWGEGVIICPGCILTVDITLGKHVIINLNCTIGHDSVIGDYVTFSPGVNVSGNVNIGDNCYIGTNAVIREKINICSDVVIWAGGVVVKDITEPGVYVGNPVKKIK